MIIRKYTNSTLYFPKILVNNRVYRLRSEISRLKDISDNKDLKDYLHKMLSVTIDNILYNHNRLIDLFNNRYLLTLDLTEGFSKLRLYKSPGIYLFKCEIGLLPIVEH